MRSSITAFAYRRIGFSCFRLALFALFSFISWNTVAAQTATPSTTKTRPRVVWSPSGDKIALTGSFGVRLLSTTLHTTTSLANSSTLSANFAAWSPDGTKLAAANADGSATIWEVSTGAQISTFQAHTTAVLGIAWKNDGSQIATASADKTIKLWQVTNPTTPQLLRTLSVPSSARTVAWSANGAKLAAGGGDSIDDSFVQTWDATSGQSLVNISADNLEGVVGALAWNPDNNRLLVAAGFLEIWDANSGSRLWVDSFSTTRPVAIQWASDGNHVISTAAHTMHILNPADDGETQTIFSGHVDTVTSISLSPDGTQIASVSNDTTIRKWEVSTGQQLAIATTPDTSSEGLKKAVLLCVGNTTLLDDLLAKIQTGNLSGFVNQIQTESGVNIAPECASNLLAMAPLILPSPTPTATNTPTNTPTRTPTPTATPTNTPVPNPGKIVFVSDRGGHNEIYVMNPNGTGQTRLTNTANGNDQPNWSPDGTKIVFHSFRINFLGALYYMNADGTGETGIATDRIGEQPAWAPNGIRIAYVHGTSSNNLCLTNTAGANIGCFTTPSGAGGAQYPAWSPDGSKIAYTTTNYKLYVAPINANGTIGAGVLVSSSVSPSRISWSPSGAKIAFKTNRDGNDEIYVMNADGSAQTRLTNNSAVDAQPSWSPSGTQIVFHSNRDGNYETYTMNADGTGVTRLTINAALDGYPVWSR